MTYRSTRAFEYPQSLEVRDLLRSGKQLQPKERGTIVQVMEGVQVYPPEDLKEAWLKRGLIEETEDDFKE